VDQTTLSMSASSDFQLAFTVRPESVDDCRQDFAASGLTMYVIGHATERHQGVRLIDQHGVARPLPGVSWRHQGGDVSTSVTDVSHV
jgi:thiamine-monophosphate kinase